MVVQSFPPGSGWTIRHWAQAVCAGLVAGLGAGALAFPHSAPVCTVLQTGVSAFWLQLGLTTNSIATERRAERAERITPWEHEQYDKRRPPRS
jgi:hypothetical protein